MNEDIRRINSPTLTATEISAGDGAIVLDPDDLDRAIVGIAENNEGDIIFCHSYEKLMEVFAEMFDESDPDTLETDVIGWIEFNVIRALPYMGNRASLILERFIEDEFRLEGPFYEFGGIRYVPYYMCP